MLLLYCHYIRVLTLLAVVSAGAMAASITGTLYLPMVLQTFAYNASYQTCPKDYVHNYLQQILYYFGLKFIVRKLQSLDFACQHNQGARLGTLSRARITWLRVGRWAPSLSHFSSRCCACVRNACLSRKTTSGHYL